jgi:GcrA cell cycle regulator
MESSSTLLEPTEQPPRPSGREQHSRAATAAEFRQALAVLNITQLRVARWFKIEPRSIRRWLDSSRRIPRGVSILFRLLVTQALTIEQLEQAVAPISVQTNSGADPKPLTPLPIAAASPQPTPSLAEKVFALAVGTCRWPCGDLGHSDFHFCGSPIVKESYCGHHHAMAHMAVPARTARSPVTWRRLAFPSSPSSSLPARQDHTR